MTSPEPPQPPDASEDPETGNAPVPPGSAPASESSVVGLGASAGGLAALRTFFAHVPADSGLSWVVVVHLSPEHESHLPDLLQPHVKMPVLQVTETVELRPDHVYVIPPNANLSAVDTHLRLSRLEESRRDRAPIDHFLRTLAATHDGHAIGVILTGTGSDGALGVKAIKEKNGLAIVQDPGEAEYDGMPQSAIATGMVDLVLPLEAIPEAVLRFARTEPKVSVPPDEEEVEGEHRRILQKVFAQLRARTGRDFTRYKRSTILRRIQRRMQITQTEELTDYLELLRNDPQELHALADNLLITVTNFFRDASMWERLEQEVVPAIFESRQSQEAIRVWSVGCATGEEAYSLAILLLEEAARRGDPRRIQVFASDLHEHSLAKARDGFYPGDITTDVSAERLSHFFQKEDGGYRVRQEVRERVVFAPHNLLGDPPFSRLDLISCRNVLIYLEPDAQRDVLDLFHYALVPEGYLVLGASETIEGSSDLFRLEDKTQHIWRKRNVQVPDARLPVFPRLGPRAYSARVLQERLATGEPLAYGALHQRMDERYAPPSMLVSPDDKVVHLSEHAGRYLMHPGGELTSNAFMLVREELRIELRAILHAARMEGHPMRSAPIDVRFNRESAPVVISVRPGVEPEHLGFCLVIFDERDEEEAKEGEGEPEAGAGGHIREVQAELDLTRQRLQAIIEEYEASQEEMRASQEELQSSNEELRSTLEELETSKEELQSMNEELQTVNQENRHKVAALARLSSDLQNLLTSTEIATLFLDRELHILRFTPQVGELFNVRPVDRGRPLSDLTHRLGYDQLEVDARQVLRALTPVEREVGDERGRWYLTRLLPYRSGEDRIEGVVITFVDITQRKRAEAAVLASEERYHALFRSMDEAYAVVEVLADGEGRWSDIRYLEVNPAFMEHTGMPYPVGRTSTELLGAPNPRWAEIYGRVAETGEPVRLEEGEPLLNRIFDLNIFRLGGDGSREIAVLFTDITSRKQAEGALRRSEERFRALVNATSFVVYHMSPDWGEMRELEGRGFLSDTKAPKQNWMEDYIHPDDQPRVLAAIQEAIRTRSIFELEHRVRRVDGSLGWTLSRAVPLLDEKGDIREWFGAASDITARKEAEEALREINETLEQRVRGRTAELEREAAERRRAEAERGEVLRQLVAAEESERRRISRELHDHLGQQLTGILLGLRSVRGEAESAALVERIGELEQLANETARDAQSMAVKLRPPALDTLGLVAALQSHLEDWGERHGIECDFHARGLDERRLSPEVETTLYRVVQEALTNVLKHASASRVSLVLERHDGTVRGVLEDDGVGFDVQQVLGWAERARRLGLRGMRERVALLGGELEIESTPGNGTSLYIRLPESKPTYRAPGEEQR